MACRGCWECLLKLLNFILALAGLSIVGYGIYLFVEFSKAADEDIPDISPVSDDFALIQLGRPMLLAVSLSNSFFDKLPNAWFIYLFVGIWSSSLCYFLFWLYWSCNKKWMLPELCYSILVVLLILVELGCAAFIFFDKNWKEEIPTDKTGDFDAIYGFLRENWNIVKWVALGIVIFQAILFLLALIVRAVNRPAGYDSDEEFINPRQQARQPLLNRPVGAATGVPVAGTIDQRPSRNDAWSTRMREKYGLDTSEFTYNPSESHRYQQVNSQQTEEKSCCTIM